MFQDNFYEVTAEIRNELLTEFKDLKAGRKNLTDADFDFYMARDRKAALILKTLDMEVRKKVVESKRRLPESPTQ